MNGMILGCVENHPFVLNAKAIVATHPTAAQGNYASKPLFFKKLIQPLIAHHNQDLLRDQVDHLHQSKIDDILDKNQTVNKVVHPRSI